MLLQKLKNPLHDWDSNPHVKFEIQIEVNRGRLSLISTSQFFLS